MLQHNRAALAGVGAALAVALLTGCNGSKDESSSSSTTSAPTATEGPVSEGPATPSAPATGPATTAAPTTAVSSTPAATGPVLSRDKKIRLSLPAGWENNTVAVGGEVNLSARSTQPLGGFSPVLLVTAAQAPGSDLVKLAANTGKQKASQVGGTYASTPARTIGGVRAPGYQVAATQQGKKLVHREYFVNHGGSLYAVTLSCAADQVAASDKQFEALLKGWAWA